MNEMSLSHNSAEWLREIKWDKMPPPNLISYQNHINTSQPVISQWLCRERELFFFFFYSWSSSKEGKRSLRRQTWVQEQSLKKINNQKQSSFVPLNRSVFRQQWQSIWRQFCRPIGGSGVHRLADPSLSPPKCSCCFCHMSAGSLRFPWRGQGGGEKMCSSRKQIEYINTGTQSWLLNTQNQRQREL